MRTPLWRTEWRASMARGQPIRPPRGNPPAATASLAIGEQVAAEVVTRFGLEEAGTG
ncbi:MAG TPA: hypothetical protein PK570_09680 [Thermoanaerobaculia bacterium]|nr:hypothetical protein [Thermoanaerobaculia bacterium]